MVDVLKRVFDAILAVVAYFTRKSAATKEAERREKVAQDAQESVGRMSDTAVRDELRKYIRPEDRTADDDADANSGGAHEKHRPL